MKIKTVIKKMIYREPNKRILKAYYKKYEKNSFRGINEANEKQLEALITRLYHTVEKGLSYEEYRAGFGKDNIQALIKALEQFAKKYGTEPFFYETALSVLEEYVKKNKEYGVSDSKLEKQIHSLPGSSNEYGGTIIFTPWSEEELRCADYKAFVENRHSVRHFTDVPVEIEKIKLALELAQHTPSACNRQGWKARLIENKEILIKVLQNQNGNRGFGQEINKLLLITADLRFFNHEREMFQAYIDGGMYAMSVLNGLHYKGIGTIPLSASLTLKQEQNVREILGIDEAEVLILFIGVGNYPDKCQTTRSQRHPAIMEVI